MSTLFFDLDGTLTDPKEGITGCIQYALRKLGEPVPSKDELTWCIGPPLLQNFEILLGEDRAELGVALYRERFADIGLFENEPYTGIHDTLGVLRQRGYELHVASSKPRVFVERIVDRYELTPYFTGVFGSELDGTRADKGELLQYCIDQLSLHDKPATMIGDRKHDAIGARRNALDFIGVLYGYGDQEEMASVGASQLVNSHEQLLKLLLGPQH